MSKAPDPPPHPPDHEPSPEERVFDANLQEFAARIGNVCGLEAGGKITPDEAYTRIKKLWKQLKHSRKSLLTEPGPDDNPGSTQSPLP